MKKWMRLAWMTAAGLATMFALTLLLQWIEELLLDHGYAMPPALFLGILFFMLYGVYALFARLTLKEIERIKAREDAPR